MERQTGRTPAAIAEEPEIPESAGLYYRAYLMLTGSRKSGFGEGPVPLSEVAAYNDLFPGLRLKFLVRFVREMDEVYLEHVAAKAKAKSKPQTKAAVPMPRIPRRRR